MTKVTELVDKVTKTVIFHKSKLNMLNKDVNLKKKVRIELLEVKNTIIIMRNSLDGSNRLLDTVKGKICEYEDIVMETKENKTERKK